MKRITSIITIMLITAAVLSAAVIVPDTSRTSFKLMSENSYEKDYTVDKTTWTVKKNGYKIDQMRTNIWALEDSAGVTLVAVNATTDDLDYTIYLYYRNKPINLITYNTPVTLETIRSIGQLKSAYISNMDKQVKAYLGAQKNVSYRSISDSTPVNIVNGRISLSSGSDGNYILVTCPDCGSKIYVNIKDYI